MGRKKIAKAIFINQYDERSEAFAQATALRQLEPSVEFRVVPYYNNTFALFAGSRQAIRDYMK